MKSTTSTTNKIVFTSLAAMREEHAKLLKHYREAGDTPEMAASIRLFLRFGQATGAVIDTEGEREAAQSLLDYWGARLFRITQQTPEVLLADFDENQAPDLPATACPYVGLDAFGEKDAGVFFGRSREIEAFLLQLQKTHLLAVVGASGSGKSSVVRAGLLAALKAGKIAGSEGWNYLPVIVPGATPLQALEKIGVQYSKDKPPSLPVPSVLVVDQFEELFTLTLDVETRQQFASLLIEMIKASHYVILTMRSDFESQVARLPEFLPLFDAAKHTITPLSFNELRSAIEQPAQIAGLKFDDGLVDQLVNDVLGEPAALPLLQFTLLKLWEKKNRNRVTWEIYNELGGGRHALANSADKFYTVDLIPEEQITAKRILLRLVRPGEGLEVTSNRLRRDELHLKSEDPGRIDRVLDKFLKARLLRISRGATPGDDQFEVAHEALVRNWPTLVEWLEEERQNLRERQRLTNAAIQWQKLDYDKSGLLRGVLLEDAERYQDLNDLESRLVRASQEARQAELNRVAREAARLRLFLAVTSTVGLVAVVALVFAVLFWRQADKAAQENAALADSRSTVAAVAQAQAFARSTAAADALQQKNEAQRQAQIGASRQLAVQALSNVNYRLDMALLLSIESYNVGSTVDNPSDGWNSLLTALQHDTRLDTYLNGHTSAIVSVAYNPDGTLLATASSDGTLILWDVSDPDQAHMVGSSLKARQVGLTAIAFDPRGSILTVGADDGSIQFWDISDPRAPLPLQASLREHTAPITDLAYSSPDDHRLASSDSSGTILIWDVADPTAPRKDGASMNIAQGKVNSLAFNPDGLTLVAANDGVNSSIGGAGTRGTITLWDIQTRQGVYQEANSSRVLSVAYSPDGRLLATSSCKSSDNQSNANNQNNLSVVTVPCSQGQVLLWDASLPSDSYRTINELTTHTDAITSLAFSQDGGTLALGSDDRTISLWNIYDPTQPYQIDTNLTVHASPVKDIAFSPDGAHLVSGDAAGVALLWKAYIGMPFIQAGPPLGGASGDYKTAAIHPQLPILVAGSTDGTITIWDIRDPATPVRLGDPIQAHSENINSIAFNPDGSLLATSSWDDSVILWDMADPAMPVPVTWLNDNAIDVEAVHFSPDGRILAASDDNRMILFWDVTDPYNPLLLTRLATPHTHWIWTFAFSPDGQTLASGDYNGGLMLWDISDIFSPQALTRDLVQAHQGALYFLAFSPDGGVLATGGVDYINLWNVADLTQNKPTPIGDPLANVSDIYTLAFSPGGDLLVSGSTTGVITVWDVRDANHPSILSEQTPSEYQPVYSVVVSPQGNTLVSAGGSAILSIWDLSNPGQLVQLSSPSKQHTGAITSLAFEPNSQLLASAGADRRLILWDTSNIGAVVLLSSQVVADYPSPLSLAFHPNRPLLAVAGCGSLDPNSGTCLRGQIRLWDVSDPSHPATPWEALSGHEGSVTSLAFTTDGSLLASGGEDGTFALWAVPDEGPPTRIRNFTDNPGGPVTSLAFRPNSRTLAMGSASGIITLWDVSNIQNITQMGGMVRAHSGGVLSLAFSPDGTLLASGGLDNSAALWNISLTGTLDQLGTPITGHYSAVRSVAFSPDGHILSTSSDDNTILMWDITNPRLPVQLGTPLTGHAGPVNSLTFSSDGSLLASGGSDATIYFWNVNTQNWIRQACQIANRNLSQAEWSQFFGDETYRLTCPNLSGAGG